MRALSRNTRRVTALTLAAALVIAVYLNWQYAGEHYSRRQRTTPSWSRQSQWKTEAETAILDALPTEASRLRCQ